MVSTTLIDTRNKPIFSGTITDKYNKIHKFLFGKTERSKAENNIKNIFLICSKCHNCTNYSIWKKDVHSRSALSNTIVKLPQNGQDVSKNKEGFKSPTYVNWENNLTSSIKYKNDGLRNNFNSPQNNITKQNSLLELLNAYRDSDKYINEHKTYPAKFDYIHQKKEKKLVSEPFSENRGQFNCKNLKSNVMGETNNSFENCKIEDLEKVVTPSRLHSFISNKEQKHNIDPVQYRQKKKPDSFTLLQSINTENSLLKLLKFINKENENTTPKSSHNYMTRRQKAIHNILDKLENDILYHISSMSVFCSKKHDLKNEMNKCCTEVQHNKKNNSRSCPDDNICKTSLKINKSNLKVADDNSMVQQSLISKPNNSSYSIRSAKAFLDIKNISYVTNRNNKMKLDYSRKTYPRPDSTTKNLKSKSKIDRNVILNKDKIKTNHNNSIHSIPSPSVSLSLVVSTPTTIQSQSCNSDSNFDINEKDLLDLNQRTERAKDTSKTQRKVSSDRPHADISSSDCCENNFNVNKNKLVFELPKNFQNTKKPAYKFNNEVVSKNETSISGKCFAKYNTDNVFPVGDKIFALNFEKPKSTEAGIAKFNMNLPKSDEIVSKEVKFEDTIPKAKMRKIILAKRGLRESKIANSQIPIKKIYSNGVQKKLKTTIADLNVENNYEKVLIAKVETKEINRENIDQTNTNVVGQLGNKIHEHLNNKTSLRAKSSSASALDEILRNESKHLDKTVEDFSHKIIMPINVVENTTALHKLAFCSLFSNEKRKQSSPETKKHKRSEFVILPNVGIPIIQMFNIGNVDIPHNTLKKLLLKKNKGHTHIQNYNNKFKKFQQDNFGKELRLFKPAEVQPCPEVYITQVFQPEYKSDASKRQNLCQKCLPLVQKVHNTPLPQIHPQKARTYVTRAYFYQLMPHDSVAIHASALDAKATIGAVDAVFKTQKQDPNSMIHSKQAYQNISSLSASSIGHKATLSKENTPDNHESIQPFQIGKAENCSERTPEKSITIGINLRPPNTHSQKPTPASKALSQPKPNSPKKGIAEIEQIKKDSSVVKYESYRFKSRSTSPTKETIEKDRIGDKKETRFRLRANFTQKGTSESKPIKKDDIAVKKENHPFKTRPRLNELSEPKRETFESKQKNGIVDKKDSHHVKPRIKSVKKESSETKQTINNGIIDKKESLPLKIRPKSSPKRVISESKKLDGILDKNSKYVKNSNIKTSLTEQTQKRPTSAKLKEKHEIEKKTKLNFSSEINLKGKQRTGNKEHFKNNSKLKSEEKANSQRVSSSSNEEKHKAVEIHETSPQAPMNLNKPQSKFSRINSSHSEPMKTKPNNIFNTNTCKAEWNIQNIQENEINLIYQSKEDSSILTPDEHTYTHANTHEFPVKGTSILNSIQNITRPKSKAKLLIVGPDNQIQEIDVKPGQIAVIHAAVLQKHTKVPNLSVSSTSINEATIFTNPIESHEFGSETKLKDIPKSPSVPMAIDLRRSVAINKTFDGSNTLKNTNEFKRQRFQKHALLNNKPNIVDIHTINSVSLNTKPLVKNVKKGYENSSPSISTQKSDNAIEKNNGNYVNFTSVSTTPLSENKSKTTKISPFMFPIKKSDFTVGETLPQNNRTKTNIKLARTTPLYTNESKTSRSFRRKSNFSLSQIVKQNIRVKNNLRRMNFNDMKQTFLEVSLEEAQKKYEADMNRKNNTMKQYDCSNNNIDLPPFINKLKPKTQTLHGKRNNTIQTAHNVPPFATHSIIVNTSTTNNRIIGKQNDTQTKKQNIETKNKDIDILNNDMDVSKKKKDRKKPEHLRKWKQPEKLKTIEIDDKLNYPQVGVKKVPIPEKGAKEAKVDKVTKEDFGMTFHVPTVTRDSFTHPHLVAQNELTTNYVMTNNLNQKTFDKKFDIVRKGLQNSLKKGPKPSTTLICDNKAVVAAIGSIEETLRTINEFSKMCGIYD